jgi:hypothetical protein
MKLTIELVPSTAWYSNMRKVLSQAQWDTVRKQCYADYHHQCGVCGAHSRLNCHEIWEYDDTNHIQRLTGYIALCDLCHHCKHLGLAGILAREGKLDMQTVIDHYCQVNGCTQVDFEKDSAAAFAQWRERSRCQWTTDLGEYAP